MYFEITHNKYHSAGIAAILLYYYIELNLFHDKVILIFMIIKK